MKKNKITLKDLKFLVDNARYSEVIRSLNTPQNYLLYLAYKEKFNLSRLVRCLDMTYSNFYRHLVLLIELELIEKKLAGREKEYIITEKGRKLMNYFLKRIK